MICPKCGRKNTSSSNYCKYDGVVLKDLLRDSKLNVKLRKKLRSTCIICGQTLKNEDNYCKDCGKSLFY